MQTKLLLVMSLMTQADRMTAWLKKTIQNCYCTKH